MQKAFLSDQEWHTAGRIDVLDKIGRKYKTDKSSLRHGYLKSYEKFFSSLRKRPITLLEIGIARGASALTWLEYFPMGRMVFMDFFQGQHYVNQPRLKAKVINALTTDRSSVVEGSQFNQDDLERVCSLYDGFDIIIDDGSHIAEHQQFSMNYLFPKLRPGGFYCIEDLHCERKSNERKTLDILKDLSSMRKIRSKYIDLEVRGLIEHRTTTCHFKQKNKLAILQVDNGTWQ